MVFDKLLDKEKVYWLNYLLRMEELFASQTKRLQESTFEAMQAGRQALLKEANEFYQDFYATVRKDLYPLVSKEALLTPEVLHYDYNSISTFSLGYIIRDWGTGEDNQQQQLITQTIEQKLQELNLMKGQETALFMGCGMGRYAVDFAPHYQKVMAFDASVLMIWCIEYLQKKGSWEVINRAERNCRTIEDTVQHKTVSMTAAQTALIQSKVDFFVANATAIPLEQQSVNHIYSIYFTDVLPLPALYEEVNKLLADQGLFIHFGPLEYFFQEEEKMISAEEVCLFFEEQGYQILVNEFLTTKHLSSENSMRHRVYDNWFFIAQKPTTILPKPIEMSTVLLLHHQAQLSSLAQIHKGACTGITYQAVLGEQSYELPAIIYELLVIINGQSTIQELLQELDLQEIDPEDQIRLLQILQELSTGKIIQSSSN